MLLWLRFGEVLSEDHQRRHPPEAAVTEHLEYLEDCCGYVTDRLVVTSGP